MTLELIKLELNKHRERRKEDMHTKRELFKTEPFLALRVTRPIRLE